MTMPARFSGRDGKQRLAKVFADQELVQHNDTIARLLAETAKVEEFQNGKQLYVKGESGKNILFFVLSGCIDLLVEDKHVVTLGPGQAVGEFPIVDPSLNYTVTVIVREQTVIASVSEEQFLSIVNKYPEIWKNMAKMLVTRLWHKDRASQQLSASDGIKPGDLKIGDLLRGLTIQQLWTIIVAVVGALATIATVSYKVGTGAW